MGKVKASVASMMHGRKKKRNKIKVKSSNEKSDEM